jgi:hypothetical protein
LLARSALRLSPRRCPRLPPGPYEHGSHLGVDLSLSLSKSPVCTPVPMTTAVISVSNSFSLSLPRSRYSREYFREAVQIPPLSGETSTAVAAHHDRAASSSLQNVSLPRYAQRIVSAENCPLRTTGRHTPHLAKIPAEIRPAPRLCRNTVRSGPQGATRCVLPRSRRDTPSASSLQKYCPLRTTGRHVTPPN